MSDQLDPRLVQTSKDGEVGILTVNNPPVNALSPGVPEGIVAGLEQFEKDDSVKAIVLIGGGRTFIAGADIKEFGKITSSGDRRKGPGFLGVLDRVEDLFQAGGRGDPWHRARRRPRNRHGLPLSRGGSIRASRPAGSQTRNHSRSGGDAAAAAIGRRGEGGRNVRRGRSHRREAALESGIIDQIVEGDLLQGALAFARSKIGTAPRRTRDLSDKLGNEQSNAPIFAFARDAARKKAAQSHGAASRHRRRRGRSQAPLRRRLRSARRSFSKPVFSPINPRRSFTFSLATGRGQDSGHLQGHGADSGEPGRRRGRRHHGRRYRDGFRQRRHPSVLKETDQAALDRGLATIRKNYANSREEGPLHAGRMDQRMARIRPTLTYDGFGEADMVVEAVFEGMALKKQVFAEMDSDRQAGRILASNTSTLTSMKLPRPPRPRNGHRHITFSARRT